MWKATSGLAALGVAGSSWFLWQDYCKRTRLPFPLLTPDTQARDGRFFLFLSERGQPDSPLVSRLRQSLTLPIYSLDKTNLPQDSGLSLDKESQIYYINTVNGKQVTSALDAYATEKLERWVQMHLHTIKDLKSKGELEAILKARKKSAFLDTVAVAYTPTKEDRETYERIVEKVMYEDPGTHVLSMVAKEHIQFYAVSDLETATTLGIVPKPGTFALYRFRDARGLFDIKSQRLTYTTAGEFGKYVDQRLKNAFKISVHQLQLDLNTYRDCYVLDPKGEAGTQRATTTFTDITEMSQSVALIDPLICPLWSPKDIQLQIGKLTRFLLYHPEGKILVVSVNDAKEEVNFNELPSLLRQMQLEEIARENKDLLVVMGSPQVLYHLPLKDFALYHFQDIEVRLLQLKGTAVASSAFYDGSSSLRDWISKPEWGQESAPRYEESYSTPLLAEEMKTQVLDGDKCYFMMFCSNTCPSCNYQMPFFEAAAKTNPTKCQFGKYNISNQSPYFKGPPATPTYLLYAPKGKQTPAQFEPREHGLSPEAMHRFITDKLGSS